MTSPGDELLGLGDVGVGDVAFADNVQRFDAVLRQPADNTRSTLPL